MGRGCGLTAVAARGRALRGAESAAARRLDREHVARLDLEGELSADVVDLFGTGTLESVASFRSLLTAIETEGGEMLAAFREHRKGERSQKFQSPHDAVATAVVAGAARAAADTKLVDADRVTAFDDFRIRQPGIGHVRMDSVGPGGVWCRAAAAADRFVIAEAAVAEG